jgi:hypothetical protein
LSKYISVTGAWLALLGAVAVSVDFFASTIMLPALGELQGNLFFDIKDYK